MARRKLTRLEQIGILAGIVIIGTFLYLKFINQDPGRKLKRTKKEYAKISSEVDRLKDEAKSGRVKREIGRLRKQVTEARRKLEETELLLAKGEAADRVASSIVRTAVENGLIIKAFDELTEKSAVEDVSGEKAPYAQRYYLITLKGRFQDLCRFLGKIDDFPKLIGIRKIDIEKIEEEAYMRAKVWICI